jgi:hypothetical protein
LNSYEDPVFLVGSSVTEIIIYKKVKEIIPWPHKKKACSLYRGLRLGVVVFNSKFPQYYSSIVVVCFNDGGSRIKPLTCRRSLTNNVYRT